MRTILNHTVYFDLILHTCTCRLCLTTGIRNILFDGLLSISQAGSGQLVKMIIAHEPHGIFGSHTYLFQHCPATDILNGVIEQALNKFKAMVITSFCQPIIIYFLALILFNLNKAIN